MARWWEVRWRRVGLALLIVFGAPVVLAGIWILVELPLDPLHRAGRLSALDPGINLVPSDLPDMSLAGLAGDRVECYGFSWQSPWAGSNVHNKHKDCLVFWPTRHVFMQVDDPSSLARLDAGLLLYAERFPGLDAKFRGSSYALESAAMSARTDEVRWWKTPLQNYRDLKLLVPKMLRRIECQGTPYRIASSEVRGFQFGNPAVAPYCVKLDLFDAADHHYALTINSGAHGPVITQAEVNAMVASLQPIGAN